MIFREKEAIYEGMNVFFGDKKRIEKSETLGQKMANYYVVFMQVLFNSRNFRP